MKHSDSKFGNKFKIFEDNSLQKSVKFINLPDKQSNFKTQKKVSH